MVRDLVAGEVLTHGGLRAIHPEYGLPVAHRERALGLAMTRDLALDMPLD